MVRQGLIWYIANPESSINGCIPISGRHTLTLKKTKMDLMAGNKPAPATMVQPPEAKTLLNTI